jgi:hypothetical protein
MTRDIDRSLETIQRARQADLINAEQASALTESAIRGMIGGGTQEAAKPVTTGEVERLTRTVGANDASVSVTRPGGENISVNANSTMASLRPPLQERCGFFTGDAVLAERDVRDAIVLSANAERVNWFSAAGNALTEDEDSQFGHLLRYWLARFSAIPPTTLTAAQTMAINGGINFGQLLNAGATNTVVAAEAARVRADLLAGAPVIGIPGNLNALVEQAIIRARQSGRITPAASRTAWSAVFVVACIRQVAIDLGLETDVGGTHEGRDELLLGNEGHRIYVLDAFRRRFGPNPNRMDGTYHAFRTSERAVQEGDIIVLDRQAGAIGGVLDFDDIPTLVGGRALHGDIVVELGVDNIIAIGGNLGDGVRRRRYPIAEDGRLIVAREQRFTQENNSGNLPAIPATNPAAGLHSLSTGRIFTVLSPVEVCAVIPGQQTHGGIIS